MEKPIPEIRRSIVQLQCTLCGRETVAACNCNAVYRPKAQQAAEAIAAHPEKSNRALAEEIGTSEATMRRARGASSDAPDTVTGRDGKEYPAKRPSYIPDPPPQLRDWLIKRALNDVRDMTPAERVEFVQQMKRL
jgi:hypothetical protein